jgi:glucose-6-phosphate isomerase
VDAGSRLTQMRAVERLAQRDATLFADPGVAAARLGWTSMARDAALCADEFAAIACDAVAAGVSDVVLLGMGGSSLAALVLAGTIAGGTGSPVLHVLDTTSPAQVAGLLRSLQPSSTLVLVSSKSGTTIEPLSLLAIFREWMAEESGQGAPAHFMAITDPGSPLEVLAADADFARIVHGPADVGGRYAALSPFATLPAALVGIDVGLLAATGQVLEDACSRPGPDNPAAALASWMSEAYSAGRDKLTIVCSPAFEGFGLWAEQLVAESTGKGGRGLLPVLEASPGLPEAHAADRMTFVLRDGGDSVLEGLSDRLPTGEPLFEVVVDDPYAIAAEFVHWEWAVTLFCALHGIEPFGQPDVEGSKAATLALLRHEAPAPEPFAASDVVEMVRGVPEGGYLAVLAYLPHDEDLLAPLRAACSRLSAASRIPVTLEMGPRYLHSTGQYHKGGPANGAFLVLTVAAADDVPVPGRPYTLAGLHAAQAAGDAAALRERGRRVLAIELPDMAALGDVADAMDGAAR